MYLRDHVVKQNPENPCPEEIFRDIVGVRVCFASKSGPAEGIIEVHRDLVPEIEELFSFMLDERFPLTCVRPIDEFQWNDDYSMSENNTSGFNYRMYDSVDGTRKLSTHAYGRAIDINPLVNPYMNGKEVRPRRAGPYDPNRVGALGPDSAVTRFLKDRGWTWGGDWTSLKDYQHFEKDL